ncbi:MAG TPA: polysaccharide deacetylase family protein [Actinoplanes sp.]|nr:polysaccharide deacetylase family protein [Actinoplanes sp.]
MSRHIRPFLGAAHRGVADAFAVLVALGVAVAVAVVAPPAARAADAAPAAATVFTRGYDTTTRVVTLTFDADWWSPGDVPTVLRILRDNGITAGFGLTGRYVESFPDQTRAIMAEGHKLINHSYDHQDFTGLTQSQRWSQLDRAELAYNRLGFTSGGWFRTPYGAGRFDPGVNRDAALDGYYVNFDWTFDTTGYQGASLPVILDRVQRYTVPGATVVMHLSTESTDTAALPSIISTLRGMGYGFTTPYRTVTRGGIGAKYAALGAQGSFLRAPWTAEMAATTGTAVQWFQGGRIYWSATTGAHEAHGGILVKYVSFGSVNSFLGFPTTDEMLASDGVGRFNHFQAGSIYWSPASGAWEVHGGIRAKWMALGAEAGLLRYPVGDEARTADGVGRYSSFQGGSIYWSPASGAWEVHGAIRAKWAALGWEQGFLRYPVSDEVAVAGGRASQFQGGNVYWSAETGACEVHGGILIHYLELGGTASALGLPTTDEYAISTGRRSDFQHGSILWNSSTGAITVIYS